MKYLKLLSICLLASFAMSISAAVTAEATIKVQGDISETPAELYLVEDNAVAPNFADPNNAPLIDGGSQFAPKFVAVNGTNEYTDVALPNLEGLQIKFIANAYETAYTMSFSGVSGAEYFLQKGDDTDPENWIPMTEDYALVCNAVSEQITFTVVKQAAPEEYIHHRAVAAGSFGTICFPNKITAMEGVKDGKLLEFVTNGVTFVEAQEVELANMEVGKAYIFEASADAQSFTYDPATSEASPIDNNGLVGTFAEDGIDIETDAWIIKGSAIKAVLAGSSVPQYRAYIPSLDDIQTIQASAPVRRFLVGEATGMQEVKAMEGTRKAIVNGRLVIIREGRMFNALGGMK